MSKRIAWVALSMVAFAGIAVAAEGLTAKDVMKKLNGGPKGALNVVKAELKGSPDWDKVTATSKEIVELTEALGKASPKKGDADSWAKHTGAWVTDAKALATAAGAHDTKAAKAAVGKLGAACKSCHTAHK